MINFSQPEYSIDENGGAVEIQLLFSNPSSIAITVEVTSEEINATGESTVHAHIHTVHVQVLFLTTRKCILL